jgi:hypothetical protein
MWNLTTPQFGDMPKITFFPQTIPLCERIFRYFWKLIAPGAVKDYNGSISISDHGKIQITANLIADIRSKKSPKKYYCSLVNGHQNIKQGKTKENNV